MTEAIAEPSFQELMMMLDDRQQLFVNEYLIDGNAARSARAVGYSEKPESSWTEGYRQLRNADVARAIKAGRKLQAERIEITKEEVLERVARVAEKAEKGDGAMPDRRAAVAAYELLSKMLGFIPDKNHAIAAASAGTKLMVNIVNQVAAPAPVSAPQEIPQSTTINSSGLSISLSRPGENAINAT